MIILEARDWKLCIKTMSNMKFMRRPRPSPSLMELYSMEDKVLCEFMDSYKESISRADNNNISMDDDSTFWLLWRILCARFHKLKELEEKNKVLQLY